MNWSDERYVRLYTRDTVEWLSWSWQARAVFQALMRKVDRAGCLDLPSDPVKATRGLSRMLDMPGEVIDDHLPELLESGAVIRGDVGLVVRNFVDAQESVTSHAERQRRYKERQAASSARDEMSPDCEPANQEVTRADAGDGSVTGVTPPVPSVPNQPSQPSRKKSTSALEVHRELATTLWAEQDALRRQAIPGALSLKPTDGALKLVAERLAEGHTAEECRHVLAVYAGDARSRPDQARWFNGETNWRPENFRRALGQPSPSQRASPRPAYGLSTDDELKRRYGGTAAIAQGGT